jgi:hypothetical protein
VPEADLLGVCPALHHPGRAIDPRGDELLARPVHVQVELVPIYAEHALQLVAAQLADPKATTAPSSRRAHWPGASASPSTAVPFRLPRSRTCHAPSRQMRAACRDDTAGCATGQVASAARPTEPEVLAREAADEDRLWVAALLGD